MKKITTEEGNKLIADFYGIHWHDNGTVSSYPILLKMRMGEETVADLRFHTSWDWLMPVVEKIEKEHQAEFTIASQVEEKDGEVTWYQDAAINLWTDEGQRYFETSSSSKIQSVWDIIIQFLEWYNNQPPPPNDPRNIIYKTY